MYPNEISEVIKDIKVSKYKLNNLHYNLPKSNLEIDQLQVDIDEMHVSINNSEEHLNSQKSKIVRLMSEAVLLNFSKDKTSYNTVKDSFITKVFFDEYVKNNRNNLSYLKEDIRHISSNLKLLIKDSENLQNDLTKRLKEKEKYNALVTNLEVLNKKLDTTENIYANKLISEESQKQLLIQKLYELNVFNDKYLSCFLKYSKGVQKAIKLISKDHTYFRKKYKRSKYLKSLVSYKRRCRINKYKKTKTLPPLKNSTITKPFGENMDIYNLNIYNYSIELSVNEINNKLYNILNGQIIFIGSVGIDDNVIVIKHSNDLYTVYKGVNKVAPNIEVGSKVKKGTIIAKVHTTLLMHVITRNRYVNPLELIEL